MGNICVIKPELGISGLDTHIINFCRVTKCPLFSGSSVNFVGVRNVVTPELLEGKLSDDSVRKITSYRVIYIPNAQREKYWWLTKKIKGKNPDIKIVDRCGNFFNNDNELKFSKKYFYKVIVPSNLLKKGLIKSGFPGKKILVLRNIIYPGGIIEDKKIKLFKKKYNVSKKFTILYPARYASMSKKGQIVTYKGLLPLIESMKYLSDDFSLLIAGSDVYDYTDATLVRKKILKFAERRGVSNKIIFLDSKDCLWKNFHTAIQASNIAAHPNIQPEPFSTVVLECMFDGKPVIISNLVGTIEIMSVKNKSCSKSMIDAVVLNTVSPNTLANKIRLLHDNQSLYNLIGKNAKNTAVRYTDEYLKKDYLNLTKGLQL